VIKFYTLYLYLAPRPKNKIEIEEKKND